MRGSMPDDCKLHLNVRLCMSHLNVSMNVIMHVRMNVRLNVLKEVSALRILFKNGDFLIAHVLQAKRLSLPKANWSPQARQALER